MEEEHAWRPDEKDEISEELREKAKIEDNKTMKKRKS